MLVLVACECSGVVRRAFRAAGHEAWSCDVQASDDDSEFHIQKDVLEVLNDRDWDLVIAHPPCTYLCVSGQHWNTRKNPDGSLKYPNRQAQTEKAVEFFMAFTQLQCKFAIENPICIMSTRWRKPDQIVQPYEYGHDASKKTCLWLSGLPKLQPTKIVSPRIVEHTGKKRKRWANQTDSGQNRLAPSKTRSKQRSQTYEGIAEAMAAQWGSL